MWFTTQMAQLANCTSIFEVAFGVNAVATAAALYFKVTHREVARRMYAEFRPPDSPVEGPLAERRFEDFILQASPGLRGARRAYRVLMFVGLGAALTAFIGLMLSATSPQTVIPSAALWAFAIFTIIVLPVAYWLYQQFLAWFEHAFTARKTTAADKTAYWRTFEAVLPLPDLRREFDEAMFDVHITLLELRWQRFRDRLVDIRDSAWRRLARLLGLRRP
jgi:hypothetical protein